MSSKGKIGTALLPSKIHLNCKITMKEKNNPSVCFPQSLRLAVDSSSWSKFNWRDRILIRHSNFSYHFLMPRLKD